MTIGIYGIYFHKADKLYVGQSSNIELRLNCHISMLNRGAHANGFMQTAYNKDKSFDSWVVQVCEISQLDEFEEYWMSQFNVINEGVNIALAYDRTKGKSGAFDTKKYKYTKEQITNVFFMLLDPANTIIDIHNKLGVSRDVINQVASLNRHNWLEEEYPEHIQTLKDTSGKRFKASNDPMRKGGKAAIVRDPELKEYLVTNQADFCKEHKLNRGWFAALIRGETKHHKGWTLKKGGVDV